MTHDTLPYASRLEEALDRHGPGPARIDAIALRLPRSVLAAVADAIDVLQNGEPAGDVELHALTLRLPRSVIRLGDAGWDNIFPRSDFSVDLCLRRDPRAGNVSWWLEVYDEIEQCRYTTPPRCTDALFRADRGGEAAVA